MAKNKKPAKVEAKAKSKAKEAVKVVANERLVEAIRSSNEAMEEARTKLIGVATVIEEEQCTRAEVVASYMEANGVEKVTAESQASRVMKLVKDPDTLEALRSGAIDLKTARAATTKKQKNPSATKKAENAEKRYNRAITQLVESAKDMGADLQSVMLSVKAALKKAGLV